jgi:hypothetical protein
VKLSPSQLNALAVYLLSRFRAVVRGKGDAIEMQIIAAVFGVVQLFGAGIPSSDEFLTRYWTTLGPVVYPPAGVDRSAMGAHLRVLCHELTHVVQFWRAPLDFVGRYLTSKGRAELEAEAERGACEVWWILTGETPANLGAVDITRHGYALSSQPGEHDDHADLTRDLLEQAVTSVRAGVLSTDVGIEAARWIRENAPDAQVGTVIL